MALVIWTEQMSVGIPAIDSQHKRLVRIINRLSDRMRERQGRLASAEALEAISNYARLHFRFEEEVIRSLGHPDLIYHIQEHQTLSARIHDIQRRFDRTSSGMISIEMLQFLRSWLVGHIIGSDKVILQAGAQLSAMMLPRRSCEETIRYLHHPT